MRSKLAFAFDSVFQRAQGNDLAQERNQELMGNRVSITRIASVSGLRGVVGRGIDPATAAEFAAAYAAGRALGAVVVGHDGRCTAPMFEAAVVASVLGVGRDVLIAGPVATPTLGKLVRDLGAVGGIQISASHNPAEYNGLKFFQPGGMVLGPAEGKAVLERWNNKQFDWASWDAIGKARAVVNPDGAHIEAILELVDVKAIRAAKAPGRARRLPWLWRSSRRRAVKKAWVHASCDWRDA